MARVAPRGWVSAEELADMCAHHQEVVRTFACDSRRHVGAQVGIHGDAGCRALARKGPLRGQKNRKLYVRTACRDSVGAGVKVGTVSHLRSTEYLVVAGSRADVGRAVAAVS